MKEGDVFAFGIACIALLLVIHIMASCARDPNWIRNNQYSNCISRAENVSECAGFIVLPTPEPLR